MKSEPPVHLNLIENLKSLVQMNKGTNLETNTLPRIEEGIRKEMCEVEELQILSENSS